MDTTMQMRPVVIGAQARSEESELTAAFQEFRLRIFHFALQKVGNHEDALDVTQDTFLRLHRHWHRRDPSRPLAPWVYSIARNLAIDILRKRGARKENDIEDAPQHHPGPGPEVLAEKNELKATVWKAINGLAEPLREVIVLRDIHGLTYAEIAEALGVPATTVTSRLHDARQKLRKKLERLL